MKTADQSSPGIYLSKTVLAHFSSFFDTTKADKPNQRPVCLFQLYFKTYAVIQNTFVPDLPPGHGNHMPRISILLSTKSISRRSGNGSFTKSTVQHNYLRLSTLSAVTGSKGKYRT